MELGLRDTGVSIPLWELVKVTFAPSDEPLAASFDEIRDFQAHSGPETRGQRSKGGGKWMELDTRGTGSIGPTIRID